MEERDRLSTSDLARQDELRRQPEEQVAETEVAPQDAGRDESRLEVDDLDQREPLLPADQSDRFTTRWQEIQSNFVDEPQKSVEEADTLVADLMQRLAASFSNERDRLESQWEGGDDVSTEDLRVALTRYRSFFDRLLSA